MDKTYTPIEVIVELTKSLKEISERNRDVTVDEIRKSTVEMLNHRIESYKDILVGLRNKELQKSGSPGHQAPLTTCTHCDKSVQWKIKDGNPGQWRCGCKGRKWTDHPVNGISSEPKEVKKDGNDLALSELGAEMSKRELCPGCTKVHSGSCTPKHIKKEEGRPAIHEFTPIPAGWGPTPDKPNNHKDAETCRKCGGTYGDTNHSASMRDYSDRFGPGGTHNSDGSKKIKKEEFIDRNHEAEPGKRLKEAHKPVGVLPGDKKSKVIESDGSGEVTVGTSKPKVFGKAAPFDFMDPKAGKPTPKPTEKPKPVAKMAPFGDKQGGNPLITKATVPMAKPPAGGTGMAPKAPPMSKPSVAPKSAAGGMPKPPGMPAMKAEPGMFKEKQTGAATALEPRATIDDHTAGPSAASSPAVTTSQGGGPSGSAGPIAPLFESGRTSASSAQLFEPKRSSLALITQAAMAKSAMSASGYTKNVKKDEVSKAPAKAKGMPGQYLADSEMEKASMSASGYTKNVKKEESPARAKGMPGQYLADSEMEKAAMPADGGMKLHANAAAHAAHQAQATPPPKIPGVIAKPHTDYSSFMPAGKFTSAGNSIPKIPGVGIKVPPKPAGLKAPIK